MRFIRQLDTGPLRDRNLARQGERYPAIGQGWSLRTATALWPATNEERGSRPAVMNCANALLRDHDDIAALLRVLAAVVSRLQRCRYVDPVMLAGVDGFLRQFVVECHFRKEDTAFFPHVRASAP